MGDREERAIVAALQALEAITDDSRSAEAFNDMQYAALLDMQDIIRSVLEGGEK